MANGHYSETLGDLGVEIPGTSVGQSDRKETIYFRYGARQQGSTVTRAFASRVPYDKEYELLIPETQDIIGCYEFTTSTHKGVCQSESTGNTIRIGERNYYILR